jgi:hypothetical protein
MSPGLRVGLRIVLEHGWAPAAVALAFLLSVGSGFADRYDWVFHLAGGAAIAYFVLRASSAAPGLASRILRTSRPLFAFGVSVVVALFWEIAEFLADRFLGTAMQHGPLETLRDLSYGALGAALVAGAARLLVTDTTQESD